MTVAWGEDDIPVASVWPFSTVIPTASLREHSGCGCHPVGVPQCLIFANSPLSHAILIAGCSPSVLNSPPAFTAISCRHSEYHKRSNHGFSVTTIETHINGTSLTLETRPQLFSPRRPDAGTLAMLSCVELKPGDRLLDLGCGYGLVGIYAATILGAENVCMIDVDPVAVEMARKNTDANDVAGVTCSVSDGFLDFDETGFTKILSNPPYHTDFSVAKHFILKGFNRLQIGGEMWFVTKRENWYRNKLKSVFGGTQLHRVDGYCVFRSEKRSETYSRRK